MPDEDTTTIDTTTTTTTDDTPPIALVNSDGSFSEKWKESLSEDIRGEKMLDNLGATNDDDVVEGIFCSQCEIVFPSHSWLQAKNFDLAIYAFCDCV